LKQIVIRGLIVTGKAGQNNPAHLLSSEKASASSYTIFAKRTNLWTLAITKTAAVQDDPGDACAPIALSFKSAKRATSPQPRRQRDTGNLSAVPEQRKNSGKMHLRLPFLVRPLPATMPYANYLRSAMPVTTRFICAIGLFSWSSCSGQSILSLSSAPAEPGGQVTLNISLNTAYPGKSAGLQWTLNSPAGEVASFNTVAGPAAASAEKSLYCAAQTCLLAGINSLPLGNGVVATVILNLSPTATGNLVVQLSNPVEALLDGSGGSITTTNGIVSVDAISVTVAPASTQLYAGQDAQLSAAIAGTTNSNLTWTMNPQVGTLSSNGLYTAPAIILNPQTVTVTATSVADPSVSGSADVYLVPVAITLIPSVISLQPWQTTQFVANVTNTSNSAIIWSLSPTLGEISSGKFSAPRRIRKPESVTVTATSVTDSTKSASAIVTLVPFPLRGPRKLPPKQ
jgi:hypothetical protein